MDFLVMRVLFCCSLIYCICSFLTFTFYIKPLEIQSLKLIFLSNVWKNGKYNRYTMIELIHLFKLTVLVFLTSRGSIFYLMNQCWAEADQPFYVNTCLYTSQHWYLRFIKNILKTNVFCPLFYHKICIN